MNIGTLRIAAIWNVCTNYGLFLPFLYCFCTTFLCFFRSQQISINIYIQYLEVVSLLWMKFNIGSWAPSAYITIVSVFGN